MPPSLSDDDNTPDDGGDDARAALANDAHRSLSLTQHAARSCSHRAAGRHWTAWCRCPRRQSPVVSNPCRARKKRTWKPGRTYDDESEQTQLFDRGDGPALLLVALPRCAGLCHHGRRSRTRAPLQLRLRLAGRSHGHRQLATSSKHRMPPPPEEPLLSWAPHPSAVNSGVVSRWYAAPEVLVGVWVVVNIASRKGSSSKTRKKTSNRVTGCISRSWFAFAGVSFETVALECVRTKCTCLIFNHDPSSPLKK